MARRAAAVPELAQALALTGLNSAYYGGDGSPDRWRSTRSWQRHVTAQARTVRSMSGGPPDAVGGGEMLECVETNASDAKWSAGVEQLGPDGLCFVGVDQQLE